MPGIPTPTTCSPSTCTHPLIYSVKTNYRVTLFSCCSYDSIGRVVRSRTYIHHHIHNSSLKSCQFHVQLLASSTYTTCRNSMVTCTVTIQWHNGVLFNVVKTVWQNANESSNSNEGLSIPLYALDAQHVCDD